MSTHESWYDDNTLLSEWSHPITNHELDLAYRTIAQMIEEVDHPVNILFDLSQVRHIPTQAPILAVRSGFLIHKNTQLVAAISTDVVPQLLADVAARVSKRTIKFFGNRKAALSYLGKDVEEKRA